MTTRTISEYRDYVSAVEILSGSPIEIDARDRGMFLVKVREIVDYYTRSFNFAIEAAGSIA